MGSIISMSSCAGFFACITCQNITKCFCRCLGIEGDSEKAAKKSKIVYLMLMTLAVFLAVLLQYSISPHLNIKGIWDIGCEETDKDAIYSTQINNCKGTAAVYRISFMSTVFFLFNAIGCLCQRRFHSNYWSSKIVIWCLLMLSSIFIPNTVFSSGYDWFSRIVSFLFLITQIVILIDFAYTWNNKWVNRANELELENRSGKPYLCGLLSISAAFYLISFTSMVFMYLYFSHCALLNSFISITLVGSLIFTYLQLFNDNEGSLLSSSIVTLYCTWLCISAITSYVDDPDTPENQKCNIINNNLDNKSSIIMGGIIAGLSLAWTSFNSFQSFSENKKEESATNQYILETEENNKDDDDNNDKDKEEDTIGTIDTIDTTDTTDTIDTTDITVTLVPDKTDDIDKTQPTENKFKSIDTDLERNMGIHLVDKIQSDTDPIVNEQYYLFHIIMMIASIYMAMLLTDWGTKKGDNEGTTTINITGGTTGMWVKITSQWITIVLYSWTLIARRCMPNRFFD